MVGTLVDGDVDGVGDDPGDVDGVGDPDDGLVADGEGAETEGTLVEIIVDVLGGETDEIGDGGEVVGGVDGDGGGGGGDVIEGVVEVVVG